MQPMNLSIPRTKVSLSGASFALDSESPFSLLYIFTGDELSSFEHNTTQIGIDSFLFSVEDSAYLDSTPVLYNIEVSIL